MNDLMERLKAQLTDCVNGFHTKSSIPHKKDKYRDWGHDRVARKVFRRLTLRHTILEHVEELTTNHENFPEGWRELDTEESRQLSKEAYRLAVTDLFVEKALSYLEVMARFYRVFGYFLCFSALATIIVGICLAYERMHEPFSFTYISQGLVIEEMAMLFIRAFTFYGLLVMLAMFLLRLGKSMLDQGERLMERRHALRQGRLFVHLNDGSLSSIEDMDKAFNWNVTQRNAFEDIKTDAKAPWGGVFNDMSKAVASLAKTTKTLAGNKLGKGTAQPSAAPEDESPREDRPGA